jgi:beta-glucosidase
LGPDVNVARLAQGGRNFESLSGEDPYLGGRLGASAVKGVQDQHIVAVAKHYVLNSQENNRLDVSENVNERVLNEIYYPPFESVI